MLKRIKRAKILRESAGCVNGCFLSQIRTGAGQNRYLRSVIFRPPLGVVCDIVPRTGRIGDFPGGSECL
ncbi:MAG: hypothetical protein KGS61_14160, partial [Verrucomicrobia bacterium]|nr:hypothetical protein [Verrucomicrobiota bacterium]